ncbi:hypothetical protein AX769_00785 [Frondihabitans sp. PAMC 28766]|uniref:SDR family NAD(P)-dependent oxidoreductase n=1 Tax=Frondihabitans sp. PAMC 28766 TaxID=1795630 RepID=UPI00078BBE4C|nr:SDR family NAD(P)-dependent oxidoreductase [Frondihabitans sp. PAMC 28766]AMM18940.1 hypothetical protein AX769_00785 [Frondihabitans sp. PAMC 28766]
MTSAGDTDFAGVAIVTGANSGLGFETARRLAAQTREATVILACRNPQKGAEAELSIRESTGNVRVKALPLDLSSLASVRAFAAEFATSAGVPIDSLVCNAGISRASGPTADGFDPVFETNHLGHFLLTLLLLPRMSPTGRIISVSSDMHQPPGPALTWPGADAVAIVQRPAKRRLRYSYSKLCNLYFTYALTRRLEAEHSTVSAAAFNPGLMTDTGFATIPAPVGAVMKKIFASRVGDLETSSTALARLASGASGARIGGQYFDRTDRMPSRSSALSYDVENARELWQVSARLVGETAAG